MINAILETHLGRPVRGLKILDIGCGNGEISTFFAGIGNDVYGVDLVDQRNEPTTDDYSFSLVDSEGLPFESALFDIVISHHVIEHTSDQGRHLDEMRRVLSPNGVAYLATPNRSSPLMEGHVGNNSVLRYRNMTPLFVRHGFRVSEYATDIIRDPERFFCEVRRARVIPRRILQLLRPMFPSHMFVLGDRGHPELPRKLPE